MLGKRLRQMQSEQVTDMGMLVEQDIYIVLMSLTSFLTRRSMTGGEFGDGAGKEIESLSNLSPWVGCGCCCAKIVPAVSYGVPLVDSISGYRTASRQLADSSSTSGGATDRINGYSLGRIDRKK